MAICEGYMAHARLSPEGGGSRLTCASVAFSDQQKPIRNEPDKDDNVDIWASIQATSKVTTAAAIGSLPPPYVHPLVRRSSSSLSQKSLEICTENLGSETGSDGFSDEYYFDSYSSTITSDNEEEENLTEEINEGVVEAKKPLAVVNYHCSIGRRSPVRSFPPPLPSISRRDGPCVHMRPHRKDGRLVVEAVPVPSQNYLHCHREGGRLLLSFIDTSFEQIYPDIEHLHQHDQLESEEQHESDNVPDEDDVAVEDEEEEEEESEEVEVLDRGIVVEVKVSRGMMNVHKSSLVINKFVSGVLPIEHNKIEIEKTEYNTTNVIATATTTTAIEDVSEWGSGGKSHAQNQTQDNKLRFTSKKLMNRQDLLHQVRRCSYHHRPLFIWESCCIATT